MNDNFKIYYIQVPLNAEGLKELDSCDEELKNVQTFELSELETDNLMDLFHKFNSSFDLLIDRYENERLPSNNVSNALVIANDYLKIMKHSLEINATRRVIEALNLAEKLNMPIDFDF